MDAVQRAQRFFKQHGREIDQARFAYHFGEASVETVVGALRQYQNPDGGFGHGLEPDIAAPVSNPFATELALLVCAQARVPGSHPVLKQAVNYLETTQQSNGSWQFAPEVYEHALAPWFAAWEWPNLNPTCSIDGLLRELGLGSERLHSRVEQFFAEKAQLADVAKGGFYNVRPYAYFFLPEWRHPRRDLYLSGVLWWLIRQHLDNSLDDSAHFFEYVRTPETYTGHHLPAGVLAERLDALEAEQAEDGGWPSPYNDYWRGWVTVQNLLVLRAFDRM